jgi:hypothetical protein
MLPADGKQSPPEHVLPRVAPPQVFCVFCQEIGVMASDPLTVQEASTRATRQSSNGDEELSQVPLGLNASPVLADSRWQPTVPTLHRQAPQAAAGAFRPE